MERIKYLEDQEHQLQAEANDLREQNELLEFRILELEETNDKVGGNIFIDNLLKYLKYAMDYIKFR